MKSRKVAAIVCLMPVAAALAGEAPIAGAHALRWFDGAGLTAPALDLLAAMDSARDWGLDPHSYGAAQILAESRATDAAQFRAKIDESLSAAAQKFISHLHFGRIDPRSAGFDMPDRGREFDPEAVLARLATTRDTRAVLSSIEPPFRHYALLKAQLGRYRALAADHGRMPLPALGAHSIAPGDPYPGAPALRSLLVALGDLPAAQQASAGDHTLDPPLVEALRRFQFRHGLAQDGVLGRQTYAALTVPLQSRIRQIELTLERWRWLPVLNAPTIIVNIPQFRLFAFASASDQESQMLTMDVIVGQTYPRTRTPAFAADLKYVEFRPYWDVPTSIMSREQLPRIRSRPDYLVSQNLEIVGRLAMYVALVLPAIALGVIARRRTPGAPLPARTRWALLALAAAGLLATLTLMASPKIGPRLYLASVALVAVAVTGWLVTQLRDARVRVLTAALAALVLVYVEARCVWTYAQVGPVGADRVYRVWHGRMGTVLVVPRYPLAGGKWFIGEDFVADNLRAAIAADYGYTAIELEPAR